MPVLSRTQTALATRGGTRRGFSLLEIMVVMLVLSLLGGMVATTALADRDQSLDDRSSIELVAFIKAAQSARSGEVFVVDEVVEAAPVGVQVWAAPETGTAPPSRSPNEISLLVSTDGTWVAAAVSTETGACVAAGAPLVGDITRRIAGDLGASCSAEWLRDGPDVQVPGYVDFGVEPPTNLYVSSYAQAVGLVVSWNHPTSGVPGTYMVLRSSAAEEESVIAEVSGSLSAYTDLTIEEDTLYTYRVVSVSGSEQSRPSEPASGSWTASDVLPPTNVQAANGFASVTLTWGASATPPALLQGYRVYRAGNLVATLGPGQLSHTFTGLTAGPHTVGVQAFGRGPASAIVSATGQALAPAVPTLFRAGYPDDGVDPDIPGSLDGRNPAGTSSAALAWKAQPAHVTQIRLYQVISGTPQLIQTLEGNVLAHTVTGLTTGQSHSFRLQAVDAVGNVSAMTDLVTVMTGWATGPDAPRNLSVTVPREMVFRPTVTWLPGLANQDGVESYRIQIRQGTNAPVVSVTVPVSQTSWQSGSNLSLTRDVSYTVSVEALRGGLYSPAATAGLLIPLAPPAVSAVAWEPAQGTTANPVPNPGSIKITFTHSGPSTQPYDGFRVNHGAVQVTASPIAITRTTSATTVTYTLSSSATMTASDTSVSVTLWGPGGWGPTTNLPFYPQVPFSASYWDDYIASVNIRWYGSTLANNYAIDSATSLTGTWTTRVSGALTPGVQNHWVEVPSPGNYYFRVRTWNSTMNRNARDVVVLPQTYIADWRPSPPSWINFPCASQATTCWINFNRTTAYTEPGGINEDPFFRYESTAGDLSVINSAWTDIDMRHSNFTSTACNASRTTTALVNGGRRLNCRVTLDATGAALPTGAHTVYARIQNSNGYLNPNWNTWSYVVRHDATAPVWAPTSTAPDLHPAAGGTLTAGTSYTFAFRGTDGHAGMANVGFTVARPTLGTTYTSPRSSTVDSAGRQSMTWNPTSIACKGSSLSFRFTLHDKAGNATSTVKAITYTIANAGITTVC
jgi:prepilin-type N-terminal cleavage/methylation domain-containing protein